MQKFTKKPVTVEAFQITKEMILNDSFPVEGVIKLAFKNSHPERKELYDYRYYIETLEGDMNVQVGDWVIKGVEGEYYPCKPDIFEQTYELPQSPNTHE
jgi:hypothetical protein